MDTNPHSCESMSSFVVRVPRARGYVKCQQTLGPNAIKLAAGLLLVVG